MKNRFNGRPWLSQMACSLGSPALGPTSLLTASLAIVWQAVTRRLRPARQENDPTGSVSRLQNQAGVEERLLNDKVADFS